MLDAKDGYHTLSIPTLSDSDYDYMPGLTNTEDEDEKDDEDPWVCTGSTKGESSDEEEDPPGPARSVQIHHTVESSDEEIREGPPGLLRPGLTYDPEDESSDDEDGEEQYATVAVNFSYNSLRARTQAPR